MNRSTALFFTVAIGIGGAFLYETRFSNKNETVTAKVDNNESGNRLLISEGNNQSTTKAAYPPAKPTITDPTGETRRPTYTSSKLKPLGEIYSKALKNGSALDSVTALKYQIACQEVEESVKILQQTDMQSKFWDMFLTSDTAKMQVKQSVESLSNYCNSYSGKNFLDQLRSNGQRLSSAIFSLMQINRPYQERFPQIVNTLSAPSTNPFEFSIWVNTDLQEILEKEFKLTSIQSGYARNLLINRFINDESTLEFNSLHQCAVKFNCSTNTVLDKSAKLAAEQTADTIESLIRRQEWQKLVYIPKSKSPE